MFIFAENVDIKPCKDCELLKTLPKTNGFPVQKQCSDPNITDQLDCEKIHPNLHQCDDCALLGEKNDKNGKLYRTCYDPTNTIFFGHWWRAFGEHSYFRRNIECLAKKTHNR